jgi:hypothetical protein
MTWAWRPLAGNAGSRARQEAAGHDDANTARSSWEGVGMDRDTAAPTRPMTLVSPPRPESGYGRLCGPKQAFVWASW